MSNKVDWKVFFKEHGNDRVQAASIGLEGEDKFTVDELYQAFFARYTEELCGPGFDPNPKG